MDIEKIHWHPAFCSAIELELKDNKDVLDFRPEQQLTKEPLRIDLLVIKKKTDEIITNEIGHFFRGYNILEYKSPQDALNIDTFFKVLAYACLYKSETGDVDEIKDNDITITIVRDSKPQKLLAQLDDKYGVTDCGNGIYKIMNMLFPMQIIVTRELDMNAHAWLKSLSKSLKQNEAEELLKRVELLKDTTDQNNVRSVLDVSTSANAELFRQIFKGGDSMVAYSSPVIREFLEPDLKELARLQLVVSQNEKTISDKNAELADKNAELADKNAEIARLKKLLEDAK